MLKIRSNNLVKTEKDKNGQGGEAAEIFSKPTEEKKNKNLPITLNIKGEKSTGAQQFFKQGWAEKDNKTYYFTSREDGRERLI